MSNHGGFRPGAGRKSSAEKEAIRSRPAERAQRIREANEIALEEAWKHVREAVKAGERWAIEKLIDQVEGKAGTKREVEPETDIHVVLPFDPNGKKRKVVVEEVASEED